MDICLPWLSNILIVGALSYMVEIKTERRQRRWDFGTLQYQREFYGFLTE